MQIKQHIETDLHLITLNAELEEKNILLRQLNNTKSRFLSLISHDVRSGIGSLDEFLRLILQNYNEKTKSELKEMITSLSESAHSSYLKLEDLLLWSKNDFVQIEPHKKIINIIDIIDKLLYSVKQEIKLKELKVIKEFHSYEALINADEDMTMAIFRNLLSNAIKYTPKGGSIYLRINPSNNKHIIEIEDTGIGMDVQTIRKLFKYDVSYKQQGTQGESSSRIGLMLVKEFLDKHGANVNVESKVEVGTKIKITWP